jgi:S-adenosyl-L-methionine hydrolase (adenosine-forming)
MAIVTITSDLGKNNHIISLIKGALLHTEPIPVIVDISHEINSFDIIQTAFIVAQSWRSFPVGTIHIIAVNDLPEAHLDWLIMEREGHVFVMQNNGLSSLIFTDEHAVIYTLPVVGEPFFILPTLLRNIMYQLSMKKLLSEINDLTLANEVVKRYKFQPISVGNIIRGAVLYIDSFDNVITNISKDLFETFSASRPFKIKMRSHLPLTEIHKNYSDAPQGEILCLFNSANLLEIAINMGKASTLFGLNPGEIIQIEFDEKN